MTSNELRWQDEEEEYPQNGLIAHQTSDSVRQQVEVSYPSCIVVLDGIRDAVWALNNEGGANKEEPSAGEYFLAIVTALNDATGASNMTNDLRKQLLQLLFVTTTASNPNLVMVEGARVLQCLRKMLSDVNYEEGSPEMDICALKCIGSILSCHKEGNAAWNSSYVVRSLMSILGRAGDPDPQVRKAAHSATREILMSTYGLSLQVPQKVVYKFCKEMLDEIEKKDSVKAKYLLKLISEICSWIGGSRASDLCESCVRLTSLGSPTISADAMRCISGLLQGQHTPSMTSSSLSHILHWLFEELHVPNLDDKSGATAFSQLLGSCLVRCMQLNPAMAREHLPLAVASLVELCEGYIPTIHKAAAQNINLVFQTVVDQEMISSFTSGKSFSFMTSLLGRTLSTLQGLMQHKYQRSWSYTIPVIGRLFLHLKEASYPVLASTLKELSQLETKLLGAPSSAAPPGSQAAIHDALGYAIEGIGVERILKILPLRPAGTQDSTGIPNDSAWLLPLLKKHGTKCLSGTCQLSYFLKEILPLARHCDSLCRRSTNSLSANKAKTQSFRVIQLWQLFPCFCSSPSDIATTLLDLVPIIARELQEDTPYPDIIPAICHGLQSLVECSKKDETVTTNNNEHEMMLMGSMSTRLLPLLFNLLEKNSGRGNDTSTPVLGAVSALVSIAPPPFVSGLFKKLLHKLLEKKAAAAAELSSTSAVSQSVTSSMETSAALCSSGESRGESEKNLVPPPLQLAYTYLDIIACMVHQLEPNCVMLCYRAIKPMIQDDQTPGIQKRAYKILLELCQYHNELILSDPSDLQAFVDLLVGSLYNCHAKSRRVRLKCLSYMVQNLQPDNEEHKAVPKAIVSEIILCMKDSNGRTRDAASELLITLGNADAVGLMKLVAAGLGGLTPHMRSGTLMALNVLNRTFAHSKSPLRQEGVAAMTPDVILTAILPLCEPHKEVVQAALEFLKVAIGGLDRQCVAALVGPICHAMFPENEVLVVNNCIAEVKGVLRKLTRKCGFDHIREAIPEKHRKVISAMQKLSEKELRTKMKLDTSRFEGSGGDGSIGGGRTRNSTDILPSSVLLREGGKKLCGQHVNDPDEEHIIDLLDENMLNHLRLQGQVRRDVINVDGSDSDSSDDCSDNDTNNHGMSMQIDKGGRLIIPCDEGDDETSPDSTTKDVKNGTGSLSQADKKYVQSSKHYSKVPEEQGEGNLTKRLRNGGESASNRQRVAKRRKMPPTRLPGSEYKSSKGGGDVQRKGQDLEPHAYIPLDASKLVRHTKHKKGQDVTQIYSAVVQGKKGRKGYQPRSRKPKKGHK